MTGCSAPNCSNHSRNGFKFYRFPADPERRKKWLINCRRQDWNPTQNDRLCSEHFEEFQFERGRADGKKRLVPFAVPTIFNVSNPPKLLNPPRKSLYKPLKLTQCTSVADRRMSYGGVNKGIHDYAKKKNAVIVDLRSDTITKPTAAMKRAMFEAEVGDDVYEEDPTVIELQKKAAELLGKENALFVSSGTMGNLIAVMNHCDVRGSEAYCGDESHVFLHEQAGAAQLAGVNLCIFPNNDDGTFDLKRLVSSIRSNRIHEPISKLVMVENTINGKIVPQSWIEELMVVARKHNLKMHLDGARLWNVSVASKISVKDLAAPFDSVTFCLSKGLGAPVGSVLCGSKSFIADARRSRKVLGGAMRQVGVIAAAGLVALKETVPRLVEDHRRALTIAQAINQLNSKIFSVNMKTMHTNMVFVNVNSESGISAETLMRRLHQVNDSNEDDRIIIRCLALTETLLRLVLHYDIDDSMVTAAIYKLRYVIKQLDPQVKI